MRFEIIKSYNIYIKNKNRLKFNQKLQTRSLKLLSLLLLVFFLNSIYFFIFFKTEELFCLSDKKHMRRN